MSVLITFLRLDSATLTKKLFPYFLSETFVDNIL